MHVFFNGKITEIENAVLSPFDRGFLFGDGVYEVIRYYPKKFFLLEDHLARLRNSLKELEIPAPDLSSIEQILNELIRVNNLTDKLSIAYLQISRGYQFPRRHAFIEEASPTFFIYVENFPAKIDEMKNGVKVGLDEDIRWTRCDIKSTSLIPNILSNKKAVRNNLAEIIWHRNGIITEGTHSNIFFVKDNTIITPPLNNFILAGITRKAILAICKQTGMESCERPVNIDEMKTFDEIFITSTLGEITPVMEINGSIANTGKPGAVTIKLQNEFQKLYADFVAP
ncbi:MAG: aminotransferase class IV [Ignavibacteriales bacterium]|nr:aminotransferase class IV [Ignavibacteriales bacterium]